MSSESSIPAPPWWHSVLPWLGFGLLALVFIVMKSFAFHWQTGDENVYFYMAWATAEHGAWPYADYFFAHPPMHLLPGIGLFASAGFGPVTARLIPILASLAGAAFLFQLVRERAGWKAALLSVFFYLGAFSLLRASSHWTGINLAVMWICAGLWALLGKKSRPLLSGFFFALGVGSGNYVLPAVVMGGLLAFLHSPRRGLRFALGFAIPWALVQLFGLLLGGQNYIDGVYRYHFNKPAKPGVARDMFVRVFGDNFALFLGLCFAPILAMVERRLSLASGWGWRDAEDQSANSENAVVRFWRWWRKVLWRDAERSLLRIGALWSLGTILFIASLPRVFPFYFLLFFPAMAWSAGVVTHRLLEHGVRAGMRFSQRDRAWREALVILSCFLLLAGLGNLVRVPVQRMLLPSYVRSHDKPMRWSDSPLPGVNGLLRACCWGDVAEAYAAYGTTREVLYHESRYFSIASGMADYVRAHSRDDQTLYGDSSTAGLVALLAGRKLAAHEADSNTMRFSSGITPAQELIRRIDDGKLKFVLAKGRVGRGRDGSIRWKLGRFARAPAFARWLRRDFEVARQFRDPIKGWYTLLRKKQGA